MEIVNQVNARVLVIYQINAAETQEERIKPIHCARIGR